MGEDSTTSCIMGIPVGLLQSFGDWWHVITRRPLVSGLSGYPIPPSASLPESWQLLPFPPPYREVNKAICLLATLLLPVWLIYGRHTVKWSEPIERFVDAIVLLWLFDIIFKSLSRSSQQLTKA